MAIKLPFNVFSWISGVWWGLETSCSLSKRSSAPNGTCTRSQLAAISSILMDFMYLHSISLISKDFRGPGFGNELQPFKLSLAHRETFARSQLAAISSIFMNFERFPWDFVDFHGFQGSGVWKGVTAFWKRNLDLKESFARSQLAAISSTIFIDGSDVMRFHGFPWISGVGGWETSCSLLKRSLALKETFARS